MEKKQKDQTLRHSVKAEQTLGIHLPTAHSAEGILPSKNSEFCWKGRIKRALTWDIS